MGSAGAESGSSSWLRFFKFFLEREPLLFRNTGDSIVGSLRDKKDNCSTRSGLRVGTGFVSFRQTPRGSGFSLLGFYTLFKCFSMFRLV